MPGNRRYLLAALALALAALAVLALAALAPAARAEIIARHGLRVDVDARLAPRRLPRHGAAPIAVSFAATIHPTAEAKPAAPAELPQLRAIDLALNAHGRLDRRGLPRCPLASLEPATSREALARCRSALIGAGRLSADVRFPAQSPFPSAGRLLAFNGRYHGRPAVLAHVYGTRPGPHSYVLPFTIHHGRGTYGTLLAASLPPVTGEWGFITALRLRLARNFTYRGRPRSYLSASCPAPSGLTIAPFPLAHATFGFADGRDLSATLTRSCRVRR